jgi:hypothetical protein
MNKKHGLLFGFAVIAIAAMVSFAGCSNSSDDDAPSSPQWPAGFTYKGTGAGVESAWENQNSETLVFYVAEGLDRVKIGDNDKFKLTAIDKSTTPYTYKISELMAGQWNDGDYFQAELSADGETLTISNVEGEANAGDYEKDEE